MDAYSSLDTSQKITDQSGSLNKLEKDNYEPLVDIDITKEESILEVFKSTDYESTISGMITLIDNYYKDIETNDDYPYFRGKDVNINVVQNTCKFIPKLNQPSEILNQKQLREVII